MSEWIYLPSISDWVSPNKPQPDPQRRVYIPEHRKNADYWFKFYMGWDLSEFEEEYPKVEDLPSCAIPLNQRVKPERPKKPEVEEISTPEPDPEPAPEPEAAPDISQPRTRAAYQYHWPFPTRDTVSLNLATGKTTFTCTEPYTPSAPRRTTLRRHITSPRRIAERTLRSSHNTHAAAFKERPPP